MNTVTLTGRLTRDPELHQLDSGTSVCRLRLAVERLNRGQETGYVDDRPSAPVVRPPHASSPRAGWSPSTAASTTTNGSPRTEHAAPRSRSSATSSSSPHHAATQAKQQARRYPPPRNGHRWVPAEPAGTQPPGGRRRRTMALPSTNTNALGRPPDRDRRVAEAHDAAARYLQLLAALAPAGSLLDVRYRVRGHGLARFFIAAHARDAAATISLIGQRTDIYVGCAPRVRRAGRRRDVAPTALLWADCDNQQATNALHDFEPRPTIVVASGSTDHVHAYWALTMPIGVAELEDANRRLAAALGADQGTVTNAAAILRVPGTKNFKHDPPRPVTLLDDAGRRYDPREITDALPASARAHSNESAARRCGASSDPLLEIDPARYVRVLTGLELGRDRKISCPFHEDRTPSLHVYPTTAGGWRCYGRCQRGGTIYDLASALWSIPTRGDGFLQLRGRLDEIFAVTRG